MPDDEFLLSENKAIGYVVDIIIDEKRVLWGEKRKKTPFYFVLRQAYIIFSGVINKI
ncbi:MAG: hypothetical protein IJ467_00195 [Bacteroidaceae bacterium]|nr:hypothetical protein [Bacteroidaceae bacterium]